MQGQRIGYVRVSSFDQNPEQQLEQTDLSKVLTDKASGKDAKYWPARLEEVGRSWGRTASTALTIRVRHDQ